MSQIYMLCVDDEPDVLEAIERDLMALESHFPLETAASAHEAREVIARIQNSGDELGVIFCDHVMPNESGVEFLSWMNETPGWEKSKKALLTGQAGLDATIAAVNNAGLDYYMAKPWDGAQLVSVAKSLLSEYVIESGKDLLLYMSMLDPVKLSKAMHDKGLASDM